MVPIHDKVNTEATQAGANIDGIYTHLLSIGIYFVGRGCRIEIA
jgi:hypothetical protein